MSREPLASFLSSRRSRSSNNSSSSSSDLGDSRRRSSRTDSDRNEEKKKKGKLRDALGEEAFLHGCEAGLERRLARLDRIGVLRTAPPTASGPPTASSRRRDASQSATQPDPDRSQDRRLRDRDRPHEGDPRRERDASASLATALCRAASAGDADGLGKLLRRLGSDELRRLNAQGPDGAPPLVLAAARGHLHVVRALLSGRHRRHVDADARSEPAGRTAVHAAVRNGHHEVVRLLLLQGASPGPRDDAERTPAAYAQRLDDGGAMLALVRVGEVRRALVEAAARGDDQGVSERLRAGRSLLSGSPRRRGGSGSEAGSEAGSSPLRLATSLWQDALDNSLLLAASGGHARVVAMLVGHGAALDASGQSSGRSALHLAVRGGHLEAARYLLDHGADPRAVDFDGRSVRDEAARSSDPAVKELLMGGGHSVSWAPEVAARGGSSSCRDSGDDDPTRTGASQSRATATATDRSSSTASSTTGSVSSRSTSSSLRRAAAGADKPPARPGANLWEDPVVLTARIPLAKLEIGEAVSRGAYGDVFRGWYRGEQVAIKQLHPSMSRDMAHISAFLGEIKLMAALEHPQIVRFVGVAWDSLAEVCAVSELMPGGDLGAMLQDLRADGAPRGFRRHPVKLKLAAEVAHALTYLHSLDPAPVLHRDLKSRNILLTADRRGAKLTDFGTSRETSDATLTAGIGTSLWMAPEVIMGERYGLKADVFSLGVVLAELATHQLPYAHATERETGRPLSIAAVLHAVVSGTIELDFAERDDQDAADDGALGLTAAAAREVVHTARSCVRLEPADRPTAAQVACALRRALQGAALDAEP